MPVWFRSYPDVGLGVFVVGHKDLRRMFCCIPGELGLLLGVVARDVAETVGGCSLFVGVRNPVVDAHNLVVVYGMAPVIGIHDCSLDRFAVVVLDTVTRCVRSCGSCNTFVDLPLGR